VSAQFPELKGKSVLVTGAAGCIGAWTVKVLQDAGAIPIVLDITESRRRLELVIPDAASVIWELGDITDYDGLVAVLKKYDVFSIIHLSALQVPLCKADPVGSTRVNVVGTACVFEAARQLKISRISYASSVAAPSMQDNEWLATLYGAHKVCGEQMAAVYWQDWQVPSIGIRPSIVYGPGRDQGMSAAATIAMLAAFGDQSYCIPFSGPVSYAYVEDTALRFVAGVAKQFEGAHVFDLNGTPEDTKRVLEIIRQHYPKADVALKGARLPFPANPDNGELESFLGLQPCRSLAVGIADTFKTLEAAQARGSVNQETIKKLIRNYQ